ncbi:hypothetical protein [Caulobacter sp. X]|jgi:hypothetical protein|uniref:hypothetical protein n=1 Tax=Caulobacter sp. X TaxID=2048901 RepID=UPI000C161824|nr:hypothetical protein [Caulobacter sp. X]PIB95290.1 hypothetical protein CSW60_22360 [Caulobacter sp. X]
METYQLADGQAVACVTPRIHRHVHHAGQDRLPVSVSIAEYRVDDTLLLAVQQAESPLRPLATQFMVSIAAHYTRQGWTIATVNATALCMKPAPGQDRPREAGNPFFSRIREHFPAYDQDSLPKIPTGFLDQSWKEDGAPSFFHPRLRLALSIDVEDRAAREVGADRFVVFATDAAGGALGKPALLETEDWGQVQRLVLAHLFAQKLALDLGPDKLAQVRERNRGLKDDCCASHDFLDANMVMNEAYIEVVGRELRADDDDDASLWTDAWGIAKARLLTAPADWEE